MKIYHLSDKDLDGYSCQYVVKHYFDDYEFYNCGYGKSNTEMFFNIVEKAKQKDEKCIILVTDNAPVESVCDDYDKVVSDKIKLFLLDHHASAKDYYDKYPWYFFDDSRCAAKITYDFFAGIYGEKKELSEFIDAVNAADIWLKDNPKFEVGKVLLNMVATTNEINKTLFRKEHNEYMNYLFDRSKEFLNQENAHIRLEENIYFIKKDFFKKDSDDTLNNLISKHIVKLLSKNKDKFSVTFEGYKGLLTTNIGNVSVIGNDFLVSNHDEYDFFVDISSKKTFSFRSNGKCDVNMIAKKVVGGGGHICASGGFFGAFKDSIDYEDIKNQVQNLFTMKGDK